MDIIASVEYVRKSIEQMESELAGLKTTLTTLEARVAEEAEAKRDLRIGDVVITTSLGYHEDVPVGVAGVITLIENHHSGKTHRVHYYNAIGNSIDYDIYSAEQLIRVSTKEEAATVSAQQKCVFIESAFNRAAEGGGFGDE